MCVGEGFFKLHVTKTDCLKDLKLGVMNLFTLLRSCGVRLSLLHAMYPQDMSEYVSPRLPLHWSP